MTIEWSDSAYVVEQGGAAGPFVLVCEHASALIPVPLAGLGLPEELRRAHIAWDPGALALARLLAERLGAPGLTGRRTRPMRCRCGAKCMTFRATRACRNRR